MEDKHYKRRNRGGNLIENLLTRWSTRVGDIKSIGLNNQPMLPRGKGRGRSVLFALLDAEAEEMNVERWERSWGHGGRGTCV